VLNETVRLFIRRWPLVLLATAAAVLVGVGGWLATPLQYQSTSQVLFLPPPQQPGVDGKVNPFLGLGASLGITADIVRIDVSDDASRADLVSRGALLDYEVTPYLAENGGPILIVTAKNGSGARTQRTVELVADEIQSDLDGLQRKAGAPADSYIKSSVLTQTPQALKVIKNRVRVSVVGAVAAWVVLLSLIILVERWRTRPRSRRARADSRAAPAPQSTTTVSSGSDAATGRRVAATRRS
jgi:hypothetical protein